MESLTVKKIIEIHHDVVEEFGGVDGVLTEATLEYLVFKAGRISDPFKRAALLLYCIAAKHPFIDGNKRTAFLTAENIMSQAGFFIQADDDEVVSFMLEVASYEKKQVVIEEWIKHHAVRLELG
jgi:death-on-curing protein